MGLLFAVLGIGHAQTTEVMGAHVHAEEMSGGGTAQTAQNAQLAVKEVGNIGAPVLACGLGIELENIREEPHGKLII